MGSEKSQRTYGVVGRTLGHSYTPAIYRMLADIDYVRFECEPDELESFIAEGTWAGVNVTIPYKRAVIPYLDELSDVARRLGNVNTITRLTDGRLRGDNTDYFGFQYMIQTLPIDITGMTALVLGGSGGAGTTAMTVLRDMGAHPISVGRTGAVTYDMLDAYHHAELLVNCTPVGMYPACPAAPCDLDALTSLRAVADIVYNPARTSLLMEAERRGIPTVGGLTMLVAQAAQACERYFGTTVDPDRIDAVTAAISSHTLNIALIGMPGSGKSHVGKALACQLERPFTDIDEAFEQKTGSSCAEFIENLGENAFRREETACLRTAAACSGAVISCGGGVVEREENYALLHQNSLIIMLDRPLEALSRKGRPITARDGIEQLASRRLPRFQAWADLVCPVLDTPEHTAAHIAELLSGLQKTSSQDRANSMRRCTIPNSTH